MNTMCGDLTSPSLIVYVEDGEKLLERVMNALNGAGSSKNYVELAKKVAEKLNEILSHADHCENDHRVILIRGLPPAFVAAAKTPSYKDETKVLCEMVFSALMLEFDFVVLQAMRKKEDEMSMILRQLCLACFHYQYLTEENK
jgi:hypothetical protein